MGPNFKGNSIFLIAERVKNCSALKPKSEFESSDDYIRRTTLFRSQRLTANITPDSDLAFVVDGEQNDPFVGPDFKYDADAQILSIRLRARHESLFVDSDIRELETVPIISLNRHTGKYVGANAFGAKVNVTTISYDVYGLAFTPNSWLFAKHDTLGLHHDFSATIPMSATEARLLKPRLKLLLVCNLSDPWFTQGLSGLSATIDSPTEIMRSLNLLQVTAKQLWLIDASTGSVIRKFVEP